MTPKGGVAMVTWPTFEAMGQIPAFHRTYFLLQLLSAIVAEMKKKSFSFFAILRLPYVCSGCCATGVL